MPLTTQDKLEPVLPNPIEAPKYKQPDAQDRRAIAALFEHEPMKGKLLETDGEKLWRVDGRRRLIASWSKDRVVERRDPRDKTFLRYLLAHRRILENLRFENVQDPDPRSKYDKAGTVRAFVRDEVVGSLEWGRRRDGKYEVDMLSVWPYYRRHGIATRMYKEWLRSERIGLRKVHVGIRTKHGKMFHQAVDASLPNPIQYFMTAMQSGGNAAQPNPTEPKKPTKLMRKIHLDHALDEIIPATRLWIHAPSKQTKQDLFDVYNSLSEQEKVEYDAHIQDTFWKQWPEGEVIAYRYKSKATMSGRSASTMRPEYMKPSEYVTIRVLPEHVFAHWADPKGVLGVGAFKHEQEIILRPGAEPEVVKPAQPNPIQQADNSDIRDALEHARDFVEHDLVGYKMQVSKPELVKIDDIPDDLSSWPEWQHGELVGMTEKERHDELVDFRGSAWAKRAEQWTPETMPPIVIVDLDDYQGVGDGRGRTSYAIGMGWKEIPAVRVTERDWAKKGNNSR